MGVQGSRFGGFVFLRGEQGVKLGKFVRPLLVVLIKCLRQAAPPDIPGKNFLFLRGGKPTGTRLVVIRFDFLQGADGGDIVFELGFGPTLTQMVIGDPEVMPFAGGDFRVQHKGRNLFPAHRRQGNKPVIGSIQRRRDFLLRG